MAIQTNAKNTPIPDNNIIGKLITNPITKSFVHCRIKHFCVLSHLCLF